MHKWFADIFIGVVVFSVLGPIMFMLDKQYMALQERQARADPAVLEACTDIAGLVQGTHYGTVKERCLLRFDRQYAQARTAGQ